MDEPNAAVVVTGGASGIGAATTAHLRRAGHGVVTVDRLPADVVADLSTPAGRQGALDAIGAGHARLRGAVVAAGVGTTDDRREVVATNYFGAVAMLDGLLPMLAGTPGASAVAISSNSVGLVDPHEDMLEAMLAGDEPSALAAADGVFGAVVYATAKRALAVAVRRRVRQWGSAGVRLNAVAPGPTETPMLQRERSDPEVGPLVDALPIPLGRSSEAAEMAEIIAWLLSDHSATIHGSVLFADGGIDAEARPDHV